MDFLENRLAIKTGFAVIVIVVLFLLGLWAADGGSGGDS